MTCCARAIITMKEYVDGDRDKQYDNLRRGRPIQERLAKQLHQDAGVPEGPCGYEELEKFQAFLGPQGYKIIVVDYVSCACLFQGKVDQHSKVIYLLKHENHYNGLRSMIAFLNRSYFCPDCCKGYDVDDAANHSCRGRNCTSCQCTRSQKIKEAARIFSQARNVPFTAKTASVISMVQTVSKPIKNQKARKKSVFVRN